MTWNGLIRIIILCCCFCGISPVFAETRPASIKIVMDNNYPPYAFKDNAGNLQGILVDQWRLWEQKTGIKAEIHAMDWGQAISRMKAGEFDVIDTLFKSDERSQWLDFTKPYAEIEVPIFFDKDIGGITDAASLKGFVVADKHGDAMINVLKQNGVENLLLFDSFEALIQSAKEHKVNIFVMGKPPAFYLLNKYGIHDRFRHSAPLHVNQFYRAVNKGNHQLLKIVEDGFALISPDELNKIDKKWYGSPLANKIPAGSILAGFGVFCLLLLLLFIWNRTLNNEVNKRTAELNKITRLLAENELRLRTLVQTLPDLVWLKNADGVYLTCNQMFERFFGAREADIVGKTDYDFVDRELADFFREHDRKAMAAGKPTSNEEWITFADDGHQALLDTIKTPMYDPEGNLVGVLGIARDITDRKNAEEKRLALERQLLHSQKLESLGILSGGIAHDFNNLLLAVLGNLDLAIMKLPAEATARNNIAQAINASKQAAKLTNMMLAYSGKGNFIIKKLDLTALVEENAAMLSAAISKNITLDQQLDHALPPVMADAGQIQQVVMNLITNASDAIGDANGTITLLTAVREFDQATLNRSRVEEKLTAGRYVCMEVRDTGCGMDAETLRKLFDPFFTTKFTGRGLGMSAVLGIVRAHKGAFLVESRPAAGTAIRVLFPIAEIERPAPATAPIAGAGPVAAAAGSGAILIVDDEEMIRGVCINLMEELGYETLVATDGNEALRIFREHSSIIDLVLLDQVMPGMDGFAVFQELRRIRPDVKVLLASGFSEQEVSERFNGMGLDGFIQKPFTLSALSDELQRVLGDAA